MNTTTTSLTIREETTRQGPNNPANNISSSPQSHVGNLFGPIFDQSVLTS